jgi:hypothetical protein
MKRTICLVILSLLCGCGANTIMEPTVEMPSVPEIPLRIGLYVSPEARDFTVKVLHQAWEAGPLLAPELDGNFRRTFSTVVNLKQVPPRGREAEDLDFYVVVEEPEARGSGGAGVGGLRVNTRIPFSVHSVNGDRIERITVEGEASVIVYLLANKDIHIYATRLIKYACRATVRKFLDTFAKRNDKPWTRDPTPQQLPAREVTASSGVYLLEQDLTFNVLDYVYVDPDSGQLTLVGHRDYRYGGGRIPYLQHLATLLENSGPQFTLPTTPESRVRANEVIDRKRTPEDRKRIVKTWSKIIDANGKITRTGTLMLPSFGVYNTLNGKKPGWLGVNTVRIKDDQLRVTKVQSDSPADRAGIRIGDEILGSGSGTLINPTELTRAVRFSGAGSEFQLYVMSEGDASWKKVILGAFTGDPWAHFTRHDFIEAVFRRAGEGSRASVIHWIGMIDRQVESGAEETSDMPMNMLFTETGTMKLARKLYKKVEAGEMTQAEKTKQVGQAFFLGIDRIFGFPDSPTQGVYDHIHRQSGFAAAWEAGNKELEKQLESVFGKALDKLWAQPEGIRIPPELVYEAFGVRPEATPKYIDLDRESLLARTMFRADYLTKSLMETPALARKLPKYQTLFAYERTHPKERRGSGRLHVWVSIGDVDVAQSKDGRTLRTRSATMQFNIRKKDKSGKSVPGKVSGYEDLLTSLYDDFSREFPVLHELRECAKLVVAVQWIREKAPFLKLPRKGLEKWRGPDKVTGFFYVVLYPPESGTNFATRFLFTGGVDLKHRAPEMKEDPSIPGVPVRAPLDSLQMMHVRINRKTYSIKVPPPFVHGQVRSNTMGKRRYERLTVELRKLESDPDASLEVIRKVGEARTLALGLNQTEELINAITSKNPELQEVVTRYGKALEKSSRDLVHHSMDFLLAGAGDILSDFRASPGEDYIEEYQTAKGEFERLQSRGKSIVAMMNEIKEGDVDALESVMPELTGFVEDFLNSIDAEQLGQHAGKVKAVQKAMKNKTHIIGLLTMGKDLSVIIPSFSKLQNEGEEAHKDFENLQKLQNIQAKQKEKLLEMFKDPDLKKMIKIKE